MRRFDLDGPEGVRWFPDQHTGTGVLVLAGSSGRTDNDRAELFARQGCVAESIRWFGGPGQHDGPWEIPLETFMTRVADLQKSCDRVILTGTSFGAEAALLCGAHEPSVAGVIAFSPSDVVWAGYDSEGRETSHWTVGGMPLPYIPVDWTYDMPDDPPRFLPLYEQSRSTFADCVPEATIAVARIAELILVAGGDDQVWPSVTHAERIRALREAAGRSTVVVTDPEAGHRTIVPGESVISTGQRMQRGGTEAADRRLGDQAWEAITALLGLS